MQKVQGTGNRNKEATVNNNVTLTRSSCRKNFVVIQILLRSLDLSIRHTAAMIKFLLVFHCKYVSILYSF